MKLKCFSSKLTENYQFNDSSWIHIITEILINCILHFAPDCPDVWTDILYWYIDSLFFFNVQANLFENTKLFPSQFCDTDVFFIFFNSLIIKHNLLGFDHN